MIGFLMHENIGIDTKINNLYQLGPEWWHKVWIWWRFGAVKGYRGNMSFFTSFGKNIFPQPYFPKAWHPKEQKKIGSGLLYLGLGFIEKYGGVTTALYHEFTQNRCAG